MSLNPPAVTNQKLICGVKNAPHTNVACKKLVPASLNLSPSAANSVTAGQKCEACAHAARHASAGCRGCFRGGVYEKWAA